MSLATRRLRPLASTASRCTRRAFFSFPDLASFSPFHQPESDTHTFHERKILPSARPLSLTTLVFTRPRYTQRQMYDVVSDVDSYRHFVPFCTASRVLRRAPLNPGGNAQQLEAELSVGFMGLSESYVSKVVCKPCESVEVQSHARSPSHICLILGTQASASSSTPLFDTLVTTWRFQPASAASPHPTAADLSVLRPPGELGPTLVSIDLAYAFAHPLHAQVSAAFFGQVSKLMIRAFEERCLAVYGPGRR